VKDLVAVSMIAPHPRATTCSALSEGNPLTQQNGVATTPGAKVPPSIVIGNFKVMHRPDGQFEATKARLAQQGFQLEETEHFLLARPEDTDCVILVHRFQSTEIDNNLVDCLMQE
jgi:hypothetical protein